MRLQTKHDLLEDILKGSRHAIHFSCAIQLTIHEWFRRINSSKFILHVTRNIFSRDAL